VVKVGKKVFVFLGRSGGGMSLSVKLPASGLLALDLPFTSPTGYGLARGGWVTAEFAKGESPPVDLLCQWVEESYRAVAPKRAVKELDPAPPRARR
jgi:predicted DNA-binding protein (MmcQ/YjbR family)